MKLVMPNKKYKESYLSAIDEMATEEKYLNQSDAIAKTNFNAFIKRLEEISRGENLQEKYVSETIFWLVDNGEYIGRVNIRHRLSPELKKWGGHIGYIIRPSKRGKGYGTKILELGLKEARKMDLKEVLITCDKGNVASKKIIEKNGGKFECEYVEEGLKEPKLRYWFDLSSSS